MSTYEKLMAVKRYLAKVMEVEKFVDWQNASIDDTKSFAMLYNTFWLTYSWTPSQMDASTAAALAASAAAVEIDPAGTRFKVQSVTVNTTNVIMLGNRSTEENMLRIQQGLRLDKRNSITLMLHLEA